METVELTFAYTQNEFVKAERQYLIAKKTIKKSDIIIYLLLLPSSVLYMLFASFNVLSVLFFTLAVFVGALGGFLYFGMPALRFKQTAKYHEEYTLIFSNDNIKFKTPTIDSQLKWDIYSEAWESGDFYYLIQPPRMYTLIPKRAFANPPAEQAFREITLSRLGNIKHIK